METDNREPIVSVVTGANSGLGYAIVQRLIEMHNSLGQNFCIVMACRNMERALKAKKALSKHLTPEDKRNSISDTADSPLQIVKIDLSSPSSVKDASNDIIKRFKKIHRLYLNAGMLSITGFDIKKFLIYMLKNGPTHSTITGGNAIMQKKAELTDEGLGLLFTCNVMGHYALVNNLKKYMNAQNSICKPIIVWVSSGTALSIKSINPDDLEGLKSDTPYEYSKRLCEIVALKTATDLLDNYQIHTYIISPGVCISNIANKNPFFKLFIFVSIIILKLLGSNAANIFPYYSAFAAVYITLKTTGDNLPPKNVVHTSATNLLFKSSVFHYDISSSLSPENPGDSLIEQLNSHYILEKWNC